ncbi:MAG: nucleotidyltransferase family protein [Acidobacteriota bacterium]|nr:nucleotidyltransferase family protein [Acidobacteriota bacterium]
MEGQHAPAGEEDRPEDGVEEKGLRAEEQKPLAGTDEKTRTRLLALLSYGGLSDTAERTLAGAAEWGDEDWENLRLTARRHGLTPLLYSRLKERLPAGTVPAKTMEALKTDFFTNAAAQMRRFHFLGRMLDAFRERGVPVIVLKGGWLAEAVYGDPALRTMDDVDLLVRREDIKKADEVMAGAGCSLLESGLVASEGENEFHYRHRTTNTLIEMHWDLFLPIYPFAMTSEEVWAAAVPATIAGSGAFALTPEDMLLHVAIHASNHCYDFGLKPLCDIAEMLARLQIDAETFLEKMERYRAVHAAGLPILLAHRLLGAQVPEAVLERLKREKPPEKLWAAAVEAVFLERPGRGKGEAVRPNMLLFMGRKSLGGKLRLALKKAFPPAKTVAVEFGLNPGSARVWLSYPRWIRKLYRENAAAIKGYFGGLARGRTAEPDDTASLMDWLMRS